MAKSFKANPGLKFNIELNDEQVKAEKFIRRKDVTIIEGKAGTGKTLVAVKYALDQLHQKEIDQIVITRPTVTAAEDLGFLPGEMEDKVEPFLIPVYDNFCKVFEEKNTKGENVVDQLLSDDKLIIAPVAFMRGRTFERAAIILDEAQNMTREQMKMAITRIGKGSKMIVCGDLLQCDLNYKKDSGMRLLSDVYNRQMVSGLDKYTLTKNHRLGIVGEFLTAFDVLAEEQEKEVPFSM